MLVDDVMAPLVLADGSKIDPTSGRVIKDRRSQQFVEIPSASEAQAIVARARRSVAELPLPPDNMNVVSLVLFYTMWGLQEQDIATTIRITIDQVRNIKKLEQYQSISDDIRRSILEHESNDIRSIFQNHARGAAEKIVDLIDEDGALGFAAAKDLLDRAGHRPADVVEHRHTMLDALRIEHVIRDENEQLPVLETTYKDVTP